MIPKKIHYIWLGGKPLPKIAEKCIKSWKKHCPDYEIRIVAQWVGDDSDYYSKVIIEGYGEAFVIEEYSYDDHPLVDQRFYPVPVLAAAGSHDGRKSG